MIYRNTRTQYHIHLLREKHMMITTWMIIIQIL